MEMASSCPYEPSESPICRTCLSNTNCGYDIFAVMCSNEVTLAATIMEFAPVKISPDDGISPFICNACVCRLENFVRFRSTCVQSTETLEKQLKSIPNEAEDDPCPNGQDFHVYCQSEQDPKIGTNSITIGNCEIKIVDDKIARRYLKDADEAVVYATEIDTEIVAESRPEAADTLDRQEYVVVAENYTDDEKYENISYADVLEDFENNKRNLLQIEDGIEICNEVEVVNQDGYVTEEYIVEYEVPEYKTVESAPLRPRSKRHKYRCEDCGRIYTVQSRLEKHRSIYHSQDRPYVCDVCGIRFTKKINLSKHMPLHSHVKPFSCEICGLDFAQRGALRKHLKYSTHTRLHIKKKGGGGDMFTCDVCKKNFSDKWTLLKHAIVHSDERPFRCAECEKCFNRPDTLRKHVATQHSDEKPFRCETCGKNFALKLLLQTHQRTHSSEKPFECPQCKMRFTSRSSMAEHLKGHATDKIHKCQLCGRRFSRKSYVARHMKIKHTDIRPHECPVCGKAFKSKSNWRDHVAIHDEVPAKCCEVCGKTFATQKQLHLHTRAVHSTVRPFKCPACGVAFPTKPDLERHSVVHSTVRPYVCDVCDRGFKRIKDLRKHAWTHDESRAHVCEICGVKFKLSATLEKHMAAHDENDKADKKA